MRPRAMKRVGFRNMKASFSGALWATTALSLLLASPAFADEAIEGTAETVRGDGSGTLPSPWNVTGTLSVGISSPATLAVEEGGVVDATGDVAIGVNLSSSVSVITLETGSSMRVGDSLVVGSIGDGILSLESGSTLEVMSDAYMGMSGGTEGEATVTGLGSTWTVGGNLTVGNFGIGTLTISDQAVVSNGDGILAANILSSGEVRVTGAGSTWTNSGVLFVGKVGGGELIVENGAAVSNGGLAALGRKAGSRGAATVTGAGSTWTSNDFLLVGDEGTGTLDITDQGEVISNSQVRIGEDPTSTGVAKVIGAGSTWANSDQFAVGFWGNGSLTIADGGAVTGAPYSTIGTWNDSVGTVVVTGTGSTWSNGGELHIGSQGSGTLRIDHGGKVSNTIGTVGDLPGSTGTVEVSGAGSTWTNSNFISVGNEGSGTVAVSDGATVTSAGAFIGHRSGQGSVEVTGAGSLWDTSASVLVGYQGSGALTVSDGGVARSTATVYLAADAGSEGSLRIGAASGDAPAAPGSLEVANVVFGDGDGEIVFNHTAAHYLFSPDIVGNGRIDLLAATTELGDAAGFTGVTSVSAGATLLVNDTLGGTLQVLSGGMLGGSGTVGAATIAGTVAPGNSIGTLNAAGDFSFASGSTYEVEVNDAGDSDRIAVAGAAVIDSGAGVHVTPENGTDDGSTYAPETTYTILTAAGGRTGEFSSLTDDFAFLSPTLTYDANNVYLKLSRDPVTAPDFCLAGSTFNQCSTGNGVEPLGPGNAVYDAVVTLSEPQALAAFDSLSGEIHASLEGMFLEDSRFAREAVNRRVRAAFANVAAAPMPVLAYGEDGWRPAAADTKRSAAWVHAFGSWGEWDGDGNAAALDRDIGGIFLGGDGAVLDTLRLGFLAGYSRTSIDVEDRASSASVDTITLGVYGGAAWGPIGLRFGAAHAWHDVEVARTAAFPGLSQTLSAAYDATTAQIFGEVGYEIDTALARLEPFAGIAWAQVTTDSFTETGGTAAVSGRDDTEELGYTTLGLRVEAELPFGGIGARLHGTFGWRHAFGDVTPASHLSFAGGTPFSVLGAPIARDALVLEAGLDFALGSNATLSVSYNGQLASEARDHGVKADFHMLF